ncbi:MAG: glucosamine-6-phosphate deaminase [Acholeplasmataceae bacterium]|nr:glucosamine-6-phosphate deaminase [Acholeplasmataceae bacterium]
MKIIIDQKDRLYDLAAKEIIKIVNDQPKAVLGLATGSSMIGVYKALVHDFKSNQTTYKDVTTFNLDEYEGISSDNHQSYAYFMNKHFFHYIDINKERTYLPSMKIDCTADYAKIYNDLLNQYELDIQLLGLGRNGHIGFNEPGTSFLSQTHRIQLDAKTRHDNARFFDSIDDVPTHAITMGIQNIMNAKKIVLIATGLNKALAVRDMLEGAVHIDCPASILQEHRDITFFLDQEAASMLSLQKKI